MGNRGNIIFTAHDRVSPCIYLHWNGGPESVYAFLEELDKRKVGADADYEAARFIQIVGEFFDHEGAGSHSLGVVSTGIRPGGRGIDRYSLLPVNTDNSDNGFYIVSRVGGLKVRRFTMGYTRVSSLDTEGEYTLQEWLPEQVAYEMERAEKHTYREGLREIFDNYRTWRSSNAVNAT